MATFQLVDRYGRYVGMATDRSELAGLSGTPMAGAIPALDKSITAIENFAQSPQGREFERRWARFWMMVIFSAVTVSTWCLPLFFRTMMHPSVLNRYRVNALITLGVGLLGLGLSGITLALGQWHWNQPLGIWSWASIGLTAMGLAALTISFIQAFITQRFASHAVSSGLGWPALIFAGMGQVPGRGCSFLQDVTLWFVAFMGCFLLFGDPVGSAIVATIGALVLMTPVWILTARHQLTRVPVAEEAAAKAN